MDIYHVLNRGVDKRTIFNDDQDRCRFVHDLYEFNDTNPAPDTYRTMWELRSPTLNRSRKPIVEIHGWVLMDNHYHLLLSEIVEGGLTKFIRRLNVGYAMYYNERHDRDGTLFQGRTKKILIDSDAYCLHILNYIHFNPLDMLENTNSWRERKIDDHNLAISHLNQYRWSSYLDYVGIANFPSILTTGFFQEIFTDYKAQAEQYLTDVSKHDLKGFKLE